MVVGLWVVTELSGLAHAKNLLPSSLPQPVWEAIPDPIVSKRPVAEYSEDSVTLPANSAWNVWLNTPIDSESQRVGEPVTATLATDVFVKTVRLFEKGDVLLGQITELYPPITGRNAIVKVLFFNLQRQTGETIPISAHVKTGLPNFVWGGELTPGTENKISIHNVMGIGEYNQVVKGGKRAEGAAVKKTLGEMMTVVLDEPITVIARQ
ncbi:MAG: hypothetical protein QE263_07225 [Vampirovibrionales bacterium]|nr:hypothetical protein [Vampirovibrionales bacterium]